MDTHTEAWQSRCTALGLQPQEIKSVSARYDMYARYTEAQGSSVLPLARWYKWYRVEKMTEGHAMRTPPASGCSVGPEVADAGAVVSETDFLNVLEMYRAQTL